MSTPTNLPETPLGGAEQDSYPKSKEKFQQQLQYIFQTTLRLTRPDQFDQLCQWMEYNQYLTIDDFFEHSYNDPEKFDTEGPATEYKWKGKMNHLSVNVAQKLKNFIRWMIHEERPSELHDDFLATLTRQGYLKFRNQLLDTQPLPTSSPFHHEPYKHQVKKRPQRKAFFSQPEEISDDDENTNEEEQFSTDPKPEEHSPYLVDQSSSHPKIPQKSFLPPNIWETPPESNKQMIIEHNKKVKLNNPTPYPSGSKPKPNPTLGKPTPAPQQVHQHSQDEPTGESMHQTPSESLTVLNNFKKGTKRDESALPQFLTHHNCDDLDPTDTPSAVPTALQAPSDDTSNPRHSHSLVETQCNHSQYPILMNKICTHSSLVTKNGEHFYGENFIHDFPKPWKHIKEVDWGDKLKLNYTTHGYMLMEIDWGGKFNYTSCGYPMANWQGHETYTTGHKTSEVDWGGHDPNGSDNPPPMSIINLDDLLGSIFLLPMDENGERKRATISEHVKDQVRLKLKIDGDQLDDLNPNHVNESLLSEVDWGAHNPDADDPEQLTGESIQSFLTFVVQLQWLVTLGRLVTHAQVTTLSKLVVASS